MSKADDDQARKTRADEIRRARDARNARIESGDATASGGSETAEGDADDRTSPNYVDMIDQKMRRDQNRDA